MGYFSELDLTKKEEYIDRSYHGFEEQLLWRYEDLKDRYFTLLDYDAPCVGDDYFSADDYRYAPVEYFKTIADVYRAMEIAKEDLETKCNIIVRDDGSIENVEDDDEDPDQITILRSCFCQLGFRRQLRHKNNLFIKFKEKHYETKTKTVS